MHAATGKLEVALSDEDRQWLRTQDERIDLESELGATWLDGALDRGIKRSERPGINPEWRKGVLTALPALLERDSRSTFAQKQIADEGPSTEHVMDNEMQKEPTVEELLQHNTPCNLRQDTTPLQGGL